ncbi:MAG: hypothetical protein U1E65_07665 [Myxococcota bacterium]
MRKPILSLLTVLALGAPSTARALSVLTPEGTAAIVERVDVVTAADQSSSTLIEQFTLSGDAPRMAVLRVFREAPTTIRADVPELISTLEEATHVDPPYHLALKHRLFGPSILTALLARIGAVEATPLADAEAPPELPRARFDEYGVQVFKGPITTSTITGERFLPAEFDAWLGTTGTVLSRINKDALLSAFAQGSTVVGMRIDRPAGEQSFVVGPIRYQLPTRAALGEPVIASSGPSKAPHYRSWCLDERNALAPNFREAVFNESPWDGLSGANVNITYFGPASAELQDALEQRFALTSSAVRVARSEIQAPLGAELSFIPARSPVEIPGKGRRGSGVDLFLCVLMGLAPLLYAPESWLLLWITANARERQRRGQSLGLVGAFWPLYALVVAGYWAYTLPDLGRWAAIGPLALGLYRLLFAPRSDLGRMVRVDFSRKKRAVLKTRPPAKAKSD